MAEKKSPPLAGLLSRIIAPIRGASKDAVETNDDVAIEQAYGSVAQIKELMAEISRLSALRSGELSKEAELEAARLEIEEGRIAALTEFRVSGDKAAKNEADDLLKKITEIVQRKTDCQAIAANIQTRIDALELKKRDLKLAYQRDLGMFLDRVFARTCNHYSSLAPDVAEAAVRMAAVQNVMLRYKAGNSNGFNRRLYLPKVNPGIGASLEALMNADSAAFVDAANQRAEDIIAEMKQAGFIYRFD